MKIRSNVWADSCKPWVSRLNDLANGGRAPSRGFSGALTSVWLGLVAGLLLTLPVTVIVSRALGPEGKGAWTLFIRYLFIFEQASAFGAAAYYAVAGSQALVERSKLIGSSLLHGLFAGMAGGTIAHLFASGLTPIGLALGPLVGVACFLLVGSRHLQHLALGLGGARVHALSNASAAFAQFVGVGALYALGQLTLGTALVVWGGGILVRGLVPFVWLCRVGRGIAPSLTVVWDSLRFGVRRVWADLDDVGNVRLILIILPVWVPLAQVGVYSVAAGIVEVFVQVGRSMAFASLASLTNAPAERIMTIIRSAVVLAGVIGILSLLTTPLIVPMFGAEFAGAVREMVWLAPAVPLLVLVRALGGVMTATQLLGPLARISVASILLLLTLAIPWIKLWGTVGGSAALTCALVVQLLLGVRALKAALGGRTRDWLVPRWSDCILVLRRLSAMLHLAHGAKR